MKNGTKKSQRWIHSHNQNVGGWRIKEEVEEEKKEEEEEEEEEEKKKEEEEDREREISGSKRKKIKISED